MIAVRGHIRTSSASEIHRLSTTHATGVVNEGVGESIMDGRKNQLWDLFADFLGPGQCRGVRSALDLALLVGGLSQLGHQQRQRHAHRHRH